MTTSKTIDLSILDQLNVKVNHTEFAQLIFPELTPKEAVTACLAAKGLSSKEIARQLNISDNTVNTYISEHIYDKLNIIHRRSYLTFAYSHRYDELVISLLLSVIENSNAKVSL